MKINAVIEKVRYHNETDGRSIFSCRGEDEFTVIGHSVLAIPGLRIEAEGEFAEYSDFGEQFGAEIISVFLPEDEEGIRALLSSGALKGVGKVTTERIIEKHGAKALEVIESDSMQLLDIKGMSKNKCEEISEAFKAIKGTLASLLEMRRFELPQISEIMLQKAFGIKAVSVILNNPYALCEGDYNIDFPKADQIATEAGISDSDKIRIEAGLKHVLRHNLDNGHTFIPMEPLCKTTGRLLSVDVELVEERLFELTEEKELVLRDIYGYEAVYLPEYYAFEDGTAEMLTALDKCYSGASLQNIDLLISGIEEKYDIKYADLQKRAIRDSVMSGVFILTGGPGTGKTTTLNGIIAAFETLGKKIVLAAPTGRAAKRLADITGRASSTIHRLLEFSGDGKTVRRNSKNKLEYEVIIIDEASMIDISLAYMLLSAVKEGTSLVFVGDRNQLPSVGAGNFLKDMINSGCFSLCELSEIFRQSRDSSIVVNSHLLLEDEEMDLDAKSGDMFFVGRETKEITADTVIDLCVNRLPKNMGIDPFFDLQILCPSRKGDIGTESLNMRLQSILNPAAPDKKEIKIYGKIFRRGDKVMQIKNNYDMIFVKEDTGEIGAGIYNGDIGIIGEINKTSNSATIRFDDRICEYPFMFFSQLDHAYAITVHKSQGNEYPAVILPVWFGHEKLQNRNLLYTAITRARELFVLCGSRDAINKMARNDCESKRFSGLCPILEELSGEN